MLTYDFIDAGGQAHRVACSRIDTAGLQELLTECRTRATHAYNGCVHSHLNPFNDDYEPPAGLRPADLRVRGATVYRPYGSFSNAGIRALSLHIPCYDITAADGREMAVLHYYTTSPRGAFEERRIFDSETCGEICRRLDDYARGGAENQEMLLSIPEGFHRSFSRHRVPAWLDRTGGAWRIKPD